MDKVREYLTQQRKMPPVLVKRTLEKLQQHPDIAGELKRWIGTGTYEVPDPVTVEGYTAADIARLAPFMDGVGVYNFLITLRTAPDRAKAQIAAGFPRK